MFNVEFPHDIGSNATIKLIGSKGVVRGWSIDADGVKWVSIEYADANKVLHTNWMRVDELEF